MKLFKILVCVFFSFFLGTTTIIAQDAIENLQLSKQQKQLLKAQKQLLKKNRAAFKATLTSEQLTILKNKALTKVQRQHALKQSLNSSQRKLIALNDASVKQAKSKFRGTLTKNQKQKLKKRFKGKKGRNKKNVRGKLRKAGKKGKRNGG
ncbi:hypothetical protein OD91_1541 [Lutibacter sp. Hel_I_33_5]|uniref:hypothetical protein n=1 Tax=Lutibacter sp. Hel_I_33_5 TaxID=1566289 RepID=UPI0011A9F9F6|nr:hypothetical protein [Lutibacter sp. Hel_I_33_5]TVZ56259.1 hypothetical protein OD91_1541 [Lutibacter sp. Hel_I_33_5]